MDPFLFPPPLSSSSDTQSDSEQHKKPLPIKIIFVIGAPGAGKGTICKQAAEKLGYYHLSAGDYLRELASKPESYNKDAYAGLSCDVLSESMKRSQLIAPEQIVQIIRFKLEQEYKVGYRKFIVDGFPRTVESAEAYEKAFGKPSMVILADCPKEVAASRFLSRAREVGDTMEKYETRYSQYAKELPAILDMYGGSYKKVDTNCDKAQAIKAALKHLEAQETTIERSRRIIADTWDWKMKLVVGAALVVGGVRFKRRFWKR